MQHFRCADAYSVFGSTIGNFRQENLPTILQLIKLGLIYHEEDNNVSFSIHFFSFFL